MPWLSIIMAIVGFIVTKLMGGSNLQALGVATLAGGGTYLLTHYTPLRNTALGSLDGAVPSPSSTPGATATNSAAPQPGGTGSSQITLPPTSSTTQDNTGTGVLGTVSSLASGALSDTSGVLKSWGATGTATVLATGAAANSGAIGTISSDIAKYFPEIALAVGGYFLLKAA